MIRAVERLFPGPERLGAPLAAAARAEAAAAAPVVLVPGMGNSRSVFNEWARSLRADGFDVHIVDLPEHGMGQALDGARALGEQLARIREQTGRTPQLLGFSYGGIVSRANLELQGGWSGVERLVTVATPHHGSRLAISSHTADRFPFLRHLPSALLDQSPDSELMRRLSASYDPAQGARYTSIYAPGFDGFVLPMDSPALEGATNVLLPRKLGLRSISFVPNHYSIIHSDHTAYEAARSALLGASHVS